MPYKNKEDANKNKREQALKRREITDKLKDVPCSDCGQKFPPICMDFDHVRGEKKFSIAQRAGRTMSLDLLLAEIDKCEIVCACCHRLRTQKRQEEKWKEEGI